MFHFFVQNVFIVYCLRRGGSFLAHLSVFCLDFLAGWHNNKFLNFNQTWLDDGEQDKEENIIIAINIKISALLILRIFIVYVQCLFFLRLQ